MVLLRVFMFQNLRVIARDGRSLDLGSPLTRSLFAYLLLNRRQAIDRRQLAFNFWPRGSETAARRNLRQYLHRLRQALEPVDPAGETITADQNGVRFNPKISIWIDVEVFRHNTRSDASLQELEEAVDLYGGDLLEEVYEDWCQEEREALRRSYTGALERLVNGLKAGGRLEEAAEFAQRWTATEPLDEAAHRQLMMVYVQKGERHRALQHYTMMANTLRRELEAEPLPETQALLHSIQTGNGFGGMANGGYAATISPSVLTQPATTAQPTPAAPLIGRKFEFERLMEALEQTQDDRGNFILISGESGVGKTRLIQEYLTHNPELPHLQGACHELEAALPFAPLRRMLVQGIDFLPASAIQAAPWHSAVVQLAPSLAERMTYAPPAPFETPDSNEMADALVSFFLTVSRYTGSNPLQLVFDDLHWGDGLTLDFLVRLTRQAACTPMMIFGLCRLEDLPPERARLLRTLERNELLVHLPLKRLSYDETIELAGHLLAPQKPDDLFLHRLYQETEGNPFFVIEIIKSLSEEGRLAALPMEVSASHHRNGMPLSIQRVIEGRLDRLPDKSRELLGAAAALGRAFSFSLLQEISQMSSEEIIACIEEWSQRGLVQEEDSGYEFSHDKIRHVVYAGMSRARRQYVHRRTAEVLERSIPPTDSGSLAHHWSRSDQPLKALPYLTQAGEQALQVRSYQEARQFGLQAVSLLGRLPGPQQRSERIDVSLQLAQAYAFTGDLSRAQEILSEIEHTAIALGDEQRLGKLFHRSAQLFWLRGKPDLAGDYARRTLRSAEELNDPHLLQAALRMLGRVGIAVSAFDDSIAYLLRYVNLDTSPPPADLPIVLGYLGIAYTRVGSWRRALEAAERGVRLAEDTAARNSDAAQAAAFARMQLAFVHADYQQWQECLETLQPALEMPELSEFQGKHDMEGVRHSLTPLGFMLLGLQGRAQAYLGDPKRGAQSIRVALAWAEQIDYRVFHYLPRIFLAEALLQSKQPVQARQEVQYALEEAHQAGNRWAVGVALRMLAEILTRLPNPDWVQIENHLIESMKVLRQVRARPDLARTYLTLRKLYDRAGQIAWAVDCHFRATSIFEELSMLDELRQAQGHAAGDRKGAVVISDMKLQGPNLEMGD